MSTKAQTSFLDAFLEELDSQSFLIPLLAILTGFIIGGFIIILTTEAVYEAFGNGIGAGLAASWDAVWLAYSSLFDSALGSPKAISESLVATTPLIFAGLAAALGFQSGLFNIGVEGQLFLGAICSAYVGYAFDLPMIIHLPFALLAGAIGGGFWGFIPGWLKANTGGHEVINTIMLNFIAFRLSEWLLNGPMQRPNSFNPVSPKVLESAQLPQFFGERFHAGFFLALAMAGVVWWLLYRSKWGYEFRTVGANPSAAQYAGMNIKWVMILAMVLSGALAGLAGANEVLGVNHNLAVAFSAGYGFDAIALALLGKNRPGGVVLAALLFGILRSGALGMQLKAGIPVDIISVLQALVLAFIAAPAIVRTVYRLRKPDHEDGGVIISGWGS